MSAIEHCQLSIDALTQHALDDEEGILSANGALTVETGKRTGRSPKDRFIVHDACTKDTISWGVANQPVEPDTFARLWKRAEDYMADKNRYVSFCKVGAHDRFFLPVKVTTEWAWHNVFARHLFIDSTEDEYNASSMNWTMLSAPHLLTDPDTDSTSSDGAVMINMTERKVLLLGMRYAGEMKKSMFSAMNFLLTEQDVLPMHCAANVGEDGDVALFFGLSGTGKTTLSADPARYLIGDDEHGWGPDGVFNFEGGCYAKCIDLSQEKEPVIWDAIRDGAVMENVVLDDQKQPDFTNTSLTKNTRVAYPLDHIEKRVLDSRGGHAKAVLFLTCDLHGVLPPVAQLNEQQAAYYFLSGYTALVGSTQVGSTVEIETTFSQFFGAPFFPRHPDVYAKLLLKRLRETECPVFLVNTGWTGGSYFSGGHRFDIDTTRSIVTAIVTGRVAAAEKTVVPGFNFEVPVSLEGVDDRVLSPRNTWSDQAAYDREAQILMKEFNENFKRFDVPDAIREAGPVVSDDS